VWTQAARQTDVNYPAATATFKAVNKKFAFVPSGKGTPERRELVASATCNNCHRGFTPEGTTSGSFHGAGRVEAPICNVCHNGRKSSTGADNEAADAMVFVHRLHASEEIADANLFHGIKFAFPPDIRNCNACHANSLQKDQWKTRPSRMACTSCHDYVGLKTTTLAKCKKPRELGPDGKPVPCQHSMGVQADTACALCHTADNIANSHQPVAPPDPNNALVKTGGSNNTHAAAASDVQAEEGRCRRGAPGLRRHQREGNHGRLHRRAERLLRVCSSTGWDRDAGGLERHGLGVPQERVDGRDHRHQDRHGHERQAGHDRLHRKRAAHMRRRREPRGGASRRVQSPVRHADVRRGDGLLHGQAVPSRDPADGDDADRRRGLQLFAGQRNDGPTCSFCHNPNRTSSAWSANGKDFIHAIHGARKRTVPFMWRAKSPTVSYAEVEFPGPISNCSACHVAGAYDFSGTAVKATVPNMPPSTEGQGKYNADPQTNATYYWLSPYVVADNVSDYGTGFSFTAATGLAKDATDTTVVTSPIMAACVACHDSPPARSHMQAAGGQLYAPRKVFLDKNGPKEQCLMCHGPGKVAAIAVVHK
jgi:hypothetical protein